MIHEDAEVTIGDGKTEVKTTLGELSKVADQFKQVADKPSIDLYAWANNLMSDREDYNIQLFFLNKNSVVYSLNTGNELTDRLRVLFLDKIMDDTFDVAEQASEVRRYEETLKGDGNIAWLPISKVRRAEEIFSWVDKYAAEIERFTHQEHDIKRVKGIFAKFTKPGAKTFYIFKSFVGGQATTKAVDFSLSKDKVSTMFDDLTFKIDPSSQVVIIDNDVFVYNQSKFEQLFDTKPHMTAIANRNGAVIDSRFKLSMPLIVKEIAILAQNSKVATKKLSEVDPNAMDQSQVLDAIDEYGIPLMTDDSGAIILMSDTDVVRFLDVLSDNYLSGINGHYLAKSKKPFEGEQDGGAGL